MEKYTFIRESTYLPENPSKILMEVDVEMHINTLLEHIQDFISACGYCNNGTLQFVEDDAL